MANLATINNNILADSGIDPLSLIVGTGTVNYVPKFTAEDTVANSQIFDNGTDVGIGTSSPFVKFDVRGEAMLLYRPAGNAYAIYSAANNTYSWQFGINNGSDYVICGGGFTGLGVEAFRITLGGNVGIGTTSPVTKLDVNGAGVIRGFLTTTDAIKLGGNTSAPTSTDAFIYRPADNTLAFGTASAERMRLDVSGNLLIGLSSALANGKLQVAGSIGLSGNTQIRQATNSDGNTLQVFATQVIAGNLNSYSYGYSGGGLLASVSAGDSILLFDAGRTTSTEGRVKIANTTLGNVSFSVEKNGVTTLFASTLGNVGIGTTSPSTKLHISNAANGNIALFTNTNDADLFINLSSGVTSLSPSTGILAFGTSSTERMRLDASGNLGLGTSSPAAKLHVAAAAVSGTIDRAVIIANSSASGSGSGSEIYLGWNSPSINAGAGVTIGASYAGGGTNMLFSTPSSIPSAPNVKMTLDGNGNLGLGVTPSAWTSTWRAIQLPGGSIYSNAGGTTGQIAIGQNWYYDGTQNRYINSAAASDYYQYAGEHRWFNAPSGTAGNAISFTQAMTLNASGQLLIGTTSAQSGTRLQVAGFLDVWSSANTLLRLNHDGTRGIIETFTGGGYAPTSINPNGGNVLIGTTTDAGYKLDVSGTARITSNLLAQKVQVGTAATINDPPGVANTLQFANYTLGAFITGSADNYIYKNSNVIGGLSSHTLIFQTRSDVAGGGFAFVSGATPSVIANISSNGAVRFNAYGSGSFTGTRAYDLSVDASGNIIEVPVGAGTITGSGTTNYIPKWTSSSAIGNSDLITDGSGNLAIAQGNAPTQALNIYRAGSTQTVMAAGNSNTGLNGTYFGVDPNGNGIINTTGAFANIFSTNGSERMRITSGGDIGIGTTAPSYKLDVQEVIRSKYGSNEGRLYLGGTPAGVAYVAGAVRAAPSPSYSYTGKLSFYTTTWGVGTDYGITEQMYIETSTSDTKAATLVMLPWGGSVGLGTTTPSSILDARVSSGATSGFRFKGWSDSATPYLLSLGTQTYQDIFQIKSVNGLVTMGIVGAVGATPDLAFQTNSTERMRITTGGNVLVGTTTDVSGVGKFVINYGSDANWGIILNNTYTATSNNGYFQRFYNNGTEIATFYAGNAAGSLFNIVGKDGLTFATGGVPTGSERMRIATNGAVRFNAYGAGSFTGTVAYNLAVDASGNIIETAGGVVDGSGTTHYVPKWSDPNTLGNSQIYDNGTNVYINAASGTGKLMVKQSAAQFYDGINSYSSTSDAFAGISHTGSVAAIYATYNSTASYTPLVFYTSDTERMRITSAGNVGIGTSSPDAIFHVARPNAGGVGGQVVIDNNAGSTLGNTAEISFLTDAGASGAGTRNARIQAVNENVGNGAANMQFWTWNGSAEAERMRITSGGDILVAGTYNPYTAANRGNITLNGTSGVIGFANGTTPRGFIFHDGTNLEIANSLSNPILFATAGNERMRITSGGLVGIGTSSPSDTLHVTGSVRSNSGSSYEVTNHGTFTLNDGTLGNYVDFLVVGSTNVGSSFVELTLSETNIGHGSIKYFIPTNYDDVYVSQTRVVLPLYTTNPRFGYAGGGYGSAIQELQIIANNTGNYTLRLVVRKVGDGSAPAWYWTAKLKNCAVSSTPNTTGINSTVYSLYRHTPLMQYDGKVGIGTSSPGERLQVNGNIYVQSGVVYGASSYSDAAVDKGMSFSGTNLLFNNSGERMRITSGGDVGIGISNPVSKLEVSSTLNSSAFTGITVSNWAGGGAEQSRAGIAFKAYDWVQSAIWHGRNTTGGTDGALVLGTNPDTSNLTVGGVVGRMWIVNNGNVGINQGNPTYKLEVNGNLGSKVGAGEAQVFITNSTSQIYLFNSYAGNTFGIFDGTAGQHRMYYDRGSNFWTFYTGASERMRITSGGDVGIGTSNPAGILDVITNNSATQLVRFYNSNTSGTGASAVRIGNGGNNNDGARLEFSDNNYYVATISGDRSQGIVFRTSATGNNPITIPERMRITSGGNVFVGSQNTLGLSLQRLTVTEDSSAAFLGIYRNNTAISQEQGGIQWMNGGAGTSIAKIAVNTSSDFTDTGNLLFFTKSSGSSQSEKMRITSGGNVLMGTTSDAGYKLDVTGTLRVNGNNNTAVALTVNGSDASEGLVAKFARGASEKNFYISATNNQYVNLATEGNFRFKTGISVNQPYTSGNDPMVLTSTGNVGIGTSSPTVKLQVSGTTLFEGGYANFLASGTIALRIGADGSNDIFMPSGRNLSISAEDNILFRTSGALTERFRITSGGNVGIGISAPTAILHTAGNTKLGGGTFQVSTDQTFISSYSYTFRDAVGINNPNSLSAATATTVMSIGSMSNGVSLITTGSVGIGTTSPTYKLQSNASSYQLALINPGYGGWLYNVGTDVSMQFVLEGTGEKMRLTSSGELLINTTSDAGDYKLQVNGNGRFVGSGINDINLQVGNNGTNAAGNTAKILFYPSGAYTGTNAPGIIYTIESSATYDVSATIQSYKDGSGVVDALTLSPAGNGTFSGSIKTAAPSGGTAATWKLGSRISNTCGLPLAYSDFVSQFMNTNKVIEVEIGGVTVYIPTVTPGWC